MVERAVLSGDIYDSLRVVSGFGVKNRGKKRRLEGVLYKEDVQYVLVRTRKPLVLLLTAL
jgi:hypothetical protein